MRQAAIIMGTGVSLDMPDCDNPAVFQKAFERLRQIDRRFSLYKPDSEVSRFSRGELAEKSLSAQLKDVIKACKAAEKLTGGYFSACAAGGFDPSGYVKGWAIAEAGKLVEEQGYGTYCLGIGGDILARSDSDKIWQIGIQDPRHPQKILNKLSISNGAVATSGNYERGQHITNPNTKQPADELLSVTVSGPDIITADVLATAAFAAGHSAAELLEKFTGYQHLIINK